VRALLALGALLSVVAAGCGGTEDATQRFAREATESHLANDPTYETGKVRCTRNPRPWFVEQQTSVVICAARRTDGRCDWYRVDLVPVRSRIGARVRLDQEDAGCVLPP
jgi:hypothetical protein